MRVTSPLVIEIGRTYGWLTALKTASGRAVGLTPGQQVYCRCSCGHEKWVRASYLLRGMTKTCARSVCPVRIGFVQGRGAAGGRGNRKAREKQPQDEAPPPPVAAQERVVPRIVVPPLPPSQRIEDELWGHIRPHEETRAERSARRLAEMQRRRRLTSETTEEIGERLGVTGRQVLRFLREKRRA